MHIIVDIGQVLRCTPSLLNLNIVKNMQRRKKKLGEILIAQGLITEDQLLQAIEYQSKSGKSIASALVELKFVTKNDLNNILGEQVHISNKKRIGEVLIEQGLITDEQLKEGLEEQKKTGKQLGRCIVQLGYITEHKLIDILAAQLDIPHVRLDNFTFSRTLLDSIPREMVKRYKAIPIFENNEAITIAMADPTDLRTIDHFKFKTGKEIDPVIASERDIMAAIDKYYSGLEKMSDIIGNIEEQKTDLDVVEEDEGEILTDEEGAQVVKIVNLIITQAVNEEASDIHIEPMENYFRLRYRVDGELVEKNPIPLQMRAQIISRLKIMAGMDIAEKRKPQDGHFQIRHQGRQVDLRVSTYPSMTRNRGVNEKVVMRIIDQEGKVMGLNQLGFLKSTLDSFEKLLTIPDGILLVTGPTGSGKSSTLYAALRRINAMYSNKKNIVTMEDPVETNLEGINQGQINVKAGFTFASGMRSILRQDPDIIMVGEMRDPETCEMAIQAALTGHLVFSTLHTNDAASAFTRLFDMRIEPYLIASTIKGILAQRLVRRICTQCKIEYIPEQYITDKLGLKPGLTMYKGKGCSSCNGSGYRGRYGVYELLIPTEAVQKMVIDRVPSDKIKNYCLKEGLFDTLRRDGLRKCLQGITTLEQVIGVSQDDG